MNPSISSLLGGEQKPWHWSNLGLWQGQDQYDHACAALAHVHAQAIKLNASDQLIDLACGGGASLALWQQHYAVTRLQALDINTPALPSPVPIINGRFDRLPLPASLQGQLFDAAICVDAAYHARSITDFLQVAHALLKPNGRLAFSTVMRPLSWQGRPGTRLSLELAGIPRASQPTQSTLINALEHDWQHANITPLNSVFSGFADHVARRKTQLTTKQKISPAWAKIVATAALCRRLETDGFQYVLISAEKR